MKAFLTRPHARWRLAVEMLMLGFVLAVIGGTLFVYAGAFDVAATDPHWSITERLLDIARTRSIKVRAAGITPPAGFDDQAKILMGVEHFADHCAVCHGAPGVPKGEIAQGLYPRPPDLDHASTHLSDGELFWIIKHGIKMTGMPSWADHGDDELWATVAFLKKLTGMSPEEYGKLVMQVMSHGGQHHPGGSGDKGETPHGSAGTVPSHEHGSGSPTPTK